MFKDNQKYVFIINFDYYSDLFLVFLFLTFSMYLLAGEGYHRCHSGFRISTNYIQPVSLRPMFVY